MHAKTKLRILPLLAIAAIPLSGVRTQAEFARFIQVKKSDAFTDGRFHLGEVEAFENGIVPDETGPAGRGLTVSSNDIGDSTLITYGDGNVLPTVGTTSTLEHGGGNKNPNNALEAGGAVWSTNQTNQPQYTLDLGGTFDVTTVRMWPRNDDCCDNRWQNLEVHLYADDGTGNPGDLVASSDDPRLAAPGGNNALELTFLPGSTLIDTVTFTPSFSYPTESDPAILSSAAAGAVVGVCKAFNEFGGVVPSATFSLVPGEGDANNGLYEFDGTPNLELTGDLSGLDGVEHSVRVRASSDEGDVDTAFTFTVILDSDNDNLIDSWELSFGTLDQFETGGDADGDGKNDEDEFADGTDPSDPSDGPMVAFSQDFEGGLSNRESTFGAFTVNDTLATLNNGTLMMGHPVAYGPLGGAATPLPSYSYYEAVVDLRGFVDAELRFDFTGGIEKDFDGFNLLVSTDGPISPPDGLLEPTSESELQYRNLIIHGQSSPELGPVAWSSSADPAVVEDAAAVFDLSAFDDQKVTIRFQFGTDALEGGEGANFDNIIVEGRRLPDTDGDGVPDNHDLNEGLDDSLIDADGDGLSNLEEFNNFTDPESDDTDGDGLLDNVETNTGIFVDENDTGTDPNNVDSDGDGLEDDVETNTGNFAGPSNTGTDPNKVDTDGDGYDDALEIENGSDPTNPNSFPELILLAYFNFDGQLADQAGNSPDLVLGGPAALTNGGMGLSGAAGDEALNLGEVNDGSFAATPAGPHLDAASTANAMSVAYWQNQTTVGNTSAFWINAPAADGGVRGFQAHTPWGNGTVFFDQSGCCDAPERLTVANVHLLEQWQHFVFQRDADGNREIWVDGVLQASAGGADPLDPFDGTITIGAQFPSANSFAGRIDDFAIFGDALTPEQVAELASGVAPIDLIGPPVAFAITLIEHQPGSGATTIEWNSRPNRVYAVDSSSDLVIWDELDDGIESEGATTSFTAEDVPAGTARHYYRVRELE